MERICEVIVDIAHANVDRLYSYLVPDGMLVSVGSHVLVPFGSGNRQSPFNHDSNKTIPIKTLLTGGERHGTVMRGHY